MGAVVVPPLEAAGGHRDTDQGRVGPRLATTGLFSRTLRAAGRESTEQQRHPGSCGDRLAHRRHRHSLSSSNQGAGLSCETRDASEPRRESAWPRSALQ
ncbi:hypothetical protein D3C74_389350 [compost metagenome]